MEELIFLFNIEFVPWDNPQGRKECFEDEMRVFLAERGMKCRISGMGGMARTRGYVEREDGPTKLEDRQQLVDWIKVQPIACKVRLGNLETCTDTTDFLREIEDMVFTVDNLNEQHRQQAADFKKQATERL